MRGPLVGAFVLALAALNLIAASPPPKDPSGLVIVPPLDRTSILELPRDVSQALSDANAFARANPHDLGYPYVDRATNTLVLSAVTRHGEDLLQQWTPTRSAATVARRVRVVTASYSRLEAVRHEAIGPGVASLPDSGLIYMTTQDDEHNRVLIVVDRRSDGLFLALATRYGTQLIAVRIEPDPGFRGIGRQDDVSPFYGGAAITTSSEGCTTGFSFLRGTAGVMVTAGHCASTGSDVYTGANGGTYHMGYIYSSSQKDENWSNSTGTELLNGGYYGDLAVVTIDSGKSSSPWMYIGTPASNTASAVKEIWSSDPAYGDQFCTGGAQSGELCGWQVTSALTDVNRGGPIARNVTVGYKSSGTCLMFGDSGSPTYTVRSDSGIAAKGINGGATNVGGTGNCQVDFTNIRYVPSAWPGTNLYTQ